MSWGAEPALPGQEQGPLFGEGSKGRCQGHGWQRQGMPGPGVMLLLFLLSAPTGAEAICWGGKGRCPGRWSPEPA